VLKRKSTKVKDNLLSWKNLQQKIFLIFSLSSLNGLASFAFDAPKKVALSIKVQ
jgi:hypothetical protein